MPQFPPPSSRPPADPGLPRLPADGTGHIGSYDHPPRWQTVAAVVLGVVLVAVPLFLWRRPRSEAAPVTRDDTGASAMEDPVDAGPEDDGGQHVVALGDVRVLECKDQGVPRSPAEPCDHVVAFEKGLVQAVVDARDCVPAGTGGGSITYVADVAFAHRRTPVLVSVPKDGRSVKNPKVVVACAAAVRKSVAALPTDGLPHAHLRYKIAVTATYADRAPDASAPSR